MVLTFKQPAWHERMTMGGLPPSFNDSLDHVITALIAIVLVSGMFVLQLQQGAVPEWAIGALGTVLGFYFRGRVNGQYNKSKMGEIQKAAEELKEAKKEVST